MGSEISYIQQHAARAASPCAAPDPAKTKQVASCTILTFHFAARHRHIRMNPFDFLSVLVSIIIALGVSFILASGARLIRLRRRVPVHGPTIIWMASLFLIQIQIWWSAFHLREVSHWTFFGFLLYLLTPMLVSMLGYLLVPEIELELAPAFDLEAEFYANRRWFFLLLGAVFLIGFANDVAFGGLYLSVNTSLRAGLLLLCLVGFLLHTKAVQWLVALVSLGAIVTYLALVNWNL